VADPDGVPAPIERVAGVYDTETRLLANSCRGIEVSDEPTTVEQEDHDSAITLVHAGTRYAAELGEDMVFFADPVDVQVGPDRHRLRVSGLVGHGGLTASVRVSVTGGQQCGYEVEWGGRLQK
jgi:hypothetical protein